LYSVILSKVHSYGLLFGDWDQLKGVRTEMKEFSNSRKRS